jgi:hypothetical protein
MMMPVLREHGTKMWDRMLCTSREFEGQKIVCVVEKDVVFRDDDGGHEADLSATHRKEVHLTAGMHAFLEKYKFLEDANVNDALTQLDPDKYLDLLDSQILRVKNCCNANANANTPPSAPIPNKRKVVSRCNSLLTGTEGYKIQYGVEVVGDTPYDQEETVAWLDAHLKEEERLHPGKQPEDWECEGTQGKGSWYHTSKGYFDAKTEVPTATPAVQKPK